jgi:hypothetical protein
LVRIKTHLLVRILTQVLIHVLLHIMARVLARVLILVLAFVFALTSAAAQAHQARQSVPSVSSGVITSMHVVQIKPFSPLTDEKRGYCRIFELDRGTGGGGGPLHGLREDLRRGLLRGAWSVFPEGFSGASRNVCPDAYQSGSQSASPSGCLDVSRHGFRSTSPGGFLSVSPWGSLSASGDAGAVSSPGAVLSALPSACPEGYFGVCSAMTPKAGDRAESS